MSDINVLKNTVKSTVIKEMSEMGHEQIVFCYDKPTGLKAIIAIHDTTLGPALGGTRIWDYATEEEALQDALRLSRGMTFKNAISGLNLGGGKAVIIGDASKIKSEAFFRRFGQFIDSLGGKYITAEDVNMTTEDIENIAKETKHVTGMPQEKGGSGDPSPVTAYGVYMGMKAAAKHAFGSDRLAGKKIAVQGVGHVGSYLVDYLVKEKAEIYITDIFEEKLNAVAQKTGATIVSSDVYSLDVDIYAPCALGATINDESINKLQCRVIAGAANNQLADEKKHGEILRKKGVVYAPDFVINAGGVTNCYAEFTGKNNSDEVYSLTRNIYDTTLNILKKADQDGITPHEAALELALKRISNASKVKENY